MPQRRAVEAINVSAARRVWSSMKHVLHTRGLLIVLVAMTFCAGAETARAAEEKPVFPVLTWDGVPADPAALIKMRECGINTLAFVPVGKLDAVRAAGLKGLVLDPRINGYNWASVDEATARKNVAEIVKETAGHPACFGYFLTDEPPAGQFGGIAKVVLLIHELAPGKLPFMNLLPNYATADQLGAKDYPTYLDTYAQTVKPNNICYDHYAILDNGALRDEYFQNLEQVRESSKKAKLPFWNTVLAVGHFSYRVPNVADFSFQAYTTLAYGGRGLAYFMYFAPNVGNYRGSPIDQFGNETATYGAMRFVNLQLQKLAPTIMKLDSDEVYHFGKLPTGTHAPSEKSLIKEMNGADFLAGDFTDPADGARYVIIVNRNVALSQPCFPKFRMEWKKVQRISPYDGGLTDFVGEQCWLQPGAGVLLKLEK
jgi:hypothetical protein